MKSHITAEANQHHPLIITLPWVIVVETSHLLEQEQGICNQNRSGDIKKGDAVRSGRTRTLQRGRTSGRRAEPVLGLHSSCFSTFYPSMCTVLFSRPELTHSS